MSTPPYIEVTFDPPLVSDSNDDFDSKAFDTIGKLNPWGGEANDLADWIGTKADQALAAAIGGDLPPLTDEALKFLRVKADESGAEFAEVPEPVTQPTADWEEGTSTTEGVVSPAKVKAAFDEFSSGYESSQFTPSSGTTTTLAHGLGATPNIVFKVIICTTAELGFSVGDKILLPPTSTAMDGNGGSTAQVDATNVKVHFGNSDIEKILDTSGSRVNLSYGNWDMIVRAYL